MASKPMSSGSKTVEYIGTGPNGATIAGGAIPNKELVFDKPDAAVGQVKGSVLLQGNVVKSVVSYKVDNTETLIFKGKAAISETKRGTGDKLSKRSVDGPVAEVNVLHDVKMCVVSHTMSTKGILFGGDDDDE